jgi:hypothetical protein
MASPLPPRRLLCAVLAIIALATAPRLSAQVAVIVNPRNAVDDISADRLKRLFLGQATTFSSGEHARLATHGPSSERFDLAALGLGREIVRARWMAMAFRGESSAVPTDFASAEDAKQFVREHADAIAYIPASDVDATVKVLRVDGHRPSDSGYPIR